MADDLVLQQQLLDARRDAADLASIVNGAATAPNVQTRLGPAIPTVARKVAAIAADEEQASAARDAAIAARDVALDARDDAVEASNVLTPRVDTPIYSHAFEAADGSAAGGFEKTSGLFVAERARFDTMNNLPVAGIARRPFSYKAALHCTSWMGQSHMQTSSSGGSHTPAQRYGMLAFPYHSNSPSAAVPLVGTSITVVGADAYTPPKPIAEGPMMGMAYVGEVAQHRDGVLLDRVNTIMLVANNATGSTSMAQNGRGGSTGNFENTLSQVTAAKALALSMGLPLVAEAVMWDQGESGTGGYNAPGQPATESYTYAGYKTAIKAFAADLDTSIRAITGGTRPVKLLTVQLNQPTQSGAPVNDGSQPTPSDTFPIARAQLDAYLDGDSTVVAVTPQYMVEYENGFHKPTRESNIIGAYLALAYHRITIDNEPWVPLTFVADGVIGNYAYVKAVGAEGPLVLDETAIPAQTDATQGMVDGWTCVDAGGTKVNVLGVTLAGTGGLRIKLASYAAGHRLRYAINAAVNRGPFHGGCGNVRDSMGDRLPVFDGNGINHRMHKWAMAQEIGI